MVAEGSGQASPISTAAVFVAGVCGRAFHATRAERQSASRMRVCTFGGRSAGVRGTYGFGIDARMVRVV